MAIVTGDRYLERLVRFVGGHAGQLLDGSLTLKLNPAGLHYVQSRLEALRELEALIADAPVDYLRAYVSDLGDHRALEQLRRILRLLTSLKVISALPLTARDPTPLSLIPFSRLRILELRGCDLSTSAARGLLELRHTLEKLICYNSTDALRHVFASRIADIKESPVWNRLSFVSCACNGLVLMDESLRLLPVVETLDLSRNRFARADNLRMCVKLKHLDLGFNQLRTIGCLSTVSCPIVRLVLRNNALTTLNGLQNLKSVEGLDLSHNIISSFSELEILASLPCLQNLWLEGNPLCCARLYRAHVYSFFSQPEKLILDEKRINTREYWERHFIFAKRQKQPGCYGFYFPAKEDAEDERSIRPKKKKHSRLASIEYDEQRTYLCSDVIHQESVSYDSEFPRKDENAVFDGDSEIVNLMNRVEYMKKEQPVFWLREFKEWFDQSSKDKVDGSHRVDFTSGHIGESSMSAPDMADISDCGNSSRLGNEYFLTNGSGISDIPVLNCSHVRGVNSEQAQLKARSRLLHDISPLELNRPSNDSSLTGEIGSQIKQKNSPTTFNAIDEIIGSRSSSLCPGSPPHYQQDILHRRLYLEEELLHLSAGSLSVASSDSDTSCSDDDSCRYHASILELDPLSIQDFSEHGTHDHSESVRCQVNHHEGHEGTYLNEDSRDSPHTRLEYLLHNQGESRLPSDNLSDHGHEIDRDVGQDVDVTEKQRSKRKPKTRVVSLAENIAECSTEGEVSSSNARLDTYKADTDTNWSISFNENYACWKAKASHSNDAHNSLLNTKSEILILN